MAAHLLVPEQHAWPTAPHAAQVLFAPQRAPTLQVIEAQQACVSAPHAAHRPAEQMKPAAHIDPVQQGWDLPPQVPQVPLAQTSAATLQVVPQQGWPVPPQVTHVPVEAQASWAPHFVVPPQHG